MALAAVSDLAGSHRKALGQQAAGALMGGGPRSSPTAGTCRPIPSRLVPADGPVWLVHGMADDRVPYLMSLDYARWARAAGARAAAATCVLLPGAGHFEVIDPLSGEWPQVAGGVPAGSAGEVPAGFRPAGPARLTWGCVIVYARVARRG